MRQRSSPDDSGQNGCRSGSPSIPAQFASGSTVSNKVKYVSNIQDVASNISSQAAIMAALGTQAGSNLPSLKNNTNDALLEDQEIGIAASLFIGLIATFIWLIKNNNSAREEMTLSNIRASLNPWYRRFKTAMALGNNIGSGIAQASLLFFPMPAWLIKLLKILLGNIVGLIFGLVGAVFFKDDLTPGNKSIFMLGRDGWSKYAKSGILPGATIGAAIGALIGFFIPIPGGMAFGIGIGTTLGAAIGFIGVTFVIPLWNKFISKIAADNYRSQYIRTGTQVGIYIGTIIGFVIGLFIPIPGAALLCSTLGAGIGMALCALVFGILGPRISRAINPEDKSYSSWDYGTRSGAMFGNQFGLGSIVIGFFSWFNVGTKQENLKDAVISGGGLIAAIIGCLYDVYCGIKNRNISQATYDAEKASIILAWSDRVRTFITMGGFTGGLIGFIIGTLIGGPAGGAIGAAIGTGIGGILSGAIGAKWGDTLYKGVVDTAKVLTNLLTSPETNEPDIDTNPAPLFAPILPPLTAETPAQTAIAETPAQTAIAKPPSILFPAAKETPQLRDGEHIIDETSSLSNR